MSKNKVKGTEEWGVFYQSGVGYSYPDENLVRLVRGDYADIPKSGRVLDVGFGTGSSLIMLAREGYEAHGLEISQASIDRAEALSEHSGVSLNLGLIEGTSLPYPDGHFDIVVSWGAVYYFGTRSLVAEAIDEFHRVLKPGGVLLLTVIHPNCSMLRRLSDDLGDGAREIDRPASSDNRFGLKIFYDGTSSGWRSLLYKFSSIDEGFVETDLFNSERRDARRLFLARK